MRAANIDRYLTVGAIQLAMCCAVHKFGKLHGKQLLVKHLFSTTNRPIAAVDAQLQQFMKVLQT